jgi:hypothetical protein
MNRQTEGLNINNLKFAEKKSEVKFTTFVVRKIRFNRLAEVNYINNQTSKSIVGIVFKILGVYLLFYKNITVLNNSDFILLLYGFL